MLVGEREDNETDKNIFEYSFNLPESDNFNIWGGDNNIQDYYNYQ